MSNIEINTDICIIGAGLVGLTAALKLANGNNRVVIVAPKRTHEDGRTTAVLMSSIRIFEDLGVWDALQPEAFPLKTMRIVDGTNNLLRAPQTDFKSSEIDLEAFGYNIKNQHALNLLEEAISKHENIETLDAHVEEIVSYEGIECVTALNGNDTYNVRAGFLVGSDGRNSIVRHSKDITTREWEYPQSAIVLDFDHELPTHYISTEFHTNSGPFTIVPHSQTRAGLVWMEKPEFVCELLSKDRQELASILEQKIQSFLGKITILTEPQSFPMKGLVANRFGKDNFALIGEAAHVFPPIGAQGFNLGVRDIIALDDVLSRHTNQENRGGKYDKKRKVDVNMRTYGVDLLNRSLISEFLPTQIVRGIGLHALGSISPLRKMAMKFGISPSFAS